MKCIPAFFTQSNTKQKRNTLSRAIACSVLLGGSLSASASPWISTEDAYLRASIQALADANIITRPVNTYPLMWKGIATDINATDISRVPSHLYFAFAHVKHALRFAQKTLVSSVKVQGTDDIHGFQNFGERHDAKGQLSVSGKVVTDNVAANLQVNYRQDDAEDQQITLDGSYLAFNAGNWVISADYVSNWWGPGKDNALIMSNNARAFPAVRLTRHSADPFEWPVLSWLGPWSATTYIGQQEHNAPVPAAKLWGARVNFRPIPALEIGLSRTAQWGGEGRSEGFGDLWDAILGRDNQFGSGGSEPGNQLAGIDIRYTQSLFGYQTGVYLEYIGEDEAGFLPSHIMELYGVDVSFGDDKNHYQAYLEYTDTFVTCTALQRVGDCAYEHHIFTNGYRRFNRSMGSTYDSDAHVVTLGLNHNMTSGYAWFGKLRFMQLNKNNTNSPDIVNPVSANHTDRVQLDLGMQFPLFNGLGQVSGYIYQQKDKQTGDKDTDGAFRLSWEYRY